MDLLYKSADEHATSYVCDNFNYYLIRLQQKISEQDYKAAYSAVLESAKEKPYQKIILSVIDNEQSPLSVPFSARSWFASYFSPQYYKLVNRDVIVGVVKPKTKLQANMMNVILGVVEKTNIKINLAYFDEEKEAVEWVKNPI